MHDHPAARLIITSEFHKGLCCMRPSTYPQRTILTLTVTKISIAILKAATTHVQVNKRNTTQPSNRGWWGGVVGMGGGDGGTNCTSSLVADTVIHVCANSTKHS
jgi:hypothetical protein